MNIEEPSQQSCNQKFQNSLTQRLTGISMWSKDKKKDHKEYGAKPTSTFYPRISLQNYITVNRNNKTAIEIIKQR